MHMVGNVFKFSIISSTVSYDDTAESFSDFEERYSKYNSKTSFVFAYNISSISLSLYVCNISPVSSLILFTFDNKGSILLSKLHVIGEYLEFLKDIFTSNEEVG